MTRRRVRLQFLMDRELSEKLEVLASAPGQTKTAVLEAALRAWVEQRGALEIENRFLQRLNRLNRQLDRLERDQKIIIESLALFVRLSFQRDGHLPEPDAEGRARGRERFEAFIAQVGRRLTQGQSEFMPAEEKPS